MLVMLAALSEVGLLLLLLASVLALMVSLLLLLVLPSVASALSMLLWLLLVVSGVQTRVEGTVWAHKWQREQGWRRG